MDLDLDSDDSGVQELSSCRQARSDEPESLSRLLVEKVQQARLIPCGVGSADPARLEPARSAYLPSRSYSGSGPGRPQRRQWRVACRVIDQAAVTYPNPPPPAVENGFTPVDPMVGVVSLMPSAVHIAGHVGG
ncbi:hypothetical protein GCM10022225_61550 [Plantactinospora mayteni]|uniref:Uncharacterized protein n=1 Tax=Plantactinospora mayteni TaxID=566021 RepID=A0ABQ4EZK3_9ACTN|nr:hypothetical protein Pma05_66750 [Plantactinospora mayteni]